MKFVYGNFKNKLNFEETQALLKTYATLFSNKNKIGFCVQRDFFEKIEDCGFEIFSQNIDLNKIDRSVNDKNYLIGHFDERSNGESDKFILEKVKKLIKNNANVLLCVGESSNAYNDGESLIALEKQIKSLHGDTRLSIAYEPFYAIGSSVAARIDDIQRCVRFLKLELPLCKILYGGSVNASNVQEILKCKEIDGILVGRASLNPADFKKLIIEI